MHKVLIDGGWRDASPAASFSAHNPLTGQTLDGEYPVSTWSDCDAALAAAQQAAEHLESTSADSLKAFLVAYADKIQANAEEIGALAELETALPLRPRLVEVEAPRTVNQLKQAADAAVSTEWRLPTIDDAAGARSCYGPLGPVLVFGPNNFPLAFNAISGGDFAAAIAAGNPVIAKAHPDHPGATRLLAELAHEAVMEAGLPPATVQLLYGMSREDGLRMVADPRLAAVSFTGSRKSGMEIKAAADAAGTVGYFEMSSVNPVFFLPGALSERGADLAAEYAGSCLLGSGQFCTCPNLGVVVGAEHGEAFVAQVAEVMSSRPAGPLLSEGTLAGLKESVQRLLKSGAKLRVGGSAVEGEGYRFQNTLLTVSAAEFLANADALQSEAFGPVTLTVTAADAGEAVAIARQIEGSLTGCVYPAADGGDDPLCGDLLKTLRRKVGRLLTNKMPTGVAVSPAMNHGGPFPATGHPGFTAVGIPASLRRFAKLDCYDNVPEQFLPAALR